MGVAPVRGKVTRAGKTLMELLGCTDYGALTKWVQDLSAPEHP